MPQVLVVDNDADLRESARFVLEDAGYEVLEAPDGEAAIELLRISTQRLVVLLDIVMPHLNGVDVLTLVRGDERLARHAFVVWTASRHPVPPELLDDLHVSLVAKPFEMDELLAVVAEAAERVVCEEMA
jgi:CheY-like chemotaxis protein